MAAPPGTCHSPGGFSTNTPLSSIPVVTMAERQQLPLPVSRCLRQQRHQHTAATLTVTAPVVTPTGVVMDDFFLDSDRQGGPVSSTNSLWYTDITGTLYANPDPPFGLVGKPRTHLKYVAGLFRQHQHSTRAPGCRRCLKASLVFTCQGTSRITNGLRLGLYDHYDAGLRLTNDANAVKNSGFNVRGYMFTRLGNGVSPTNRRPTTRETTWRCRRCHPPRIM